MTLEPPEMMFGRDLGLVLRKSILSRFGDGRQAEPDKSKVSDKQKGGI